MGRVCNGLFLVKNHFTHPVLPVKDRAALPSTIYEGRLNQLNMSLKKITELGRPPIAVIYTRVSSEEQTHGYSLESQGKYNEEYAVRNKWQTARIFREEGESAKTADRTQLRLMQEYCLKNMGKIGYVVVWKLDRLARNHMDYLMLKKFFNDLGIEIKSATEIIENTPIGHVSEGMLSLMAQYENEVKTERTVMGMRAKALDGYWPVGAPWGWKNVPDPVRRSIIVPHPERAAIVQYAYEEYARGTITFLELAKKINDKWDATTKHGLKMSKQTVYKVLINPIHHGWIELPKWGISLQGRHAPIISKELYDDVQERIRGGKKKKIRNRNNPDFPLRGVICGFCGSNLSGGRVKGRNKTYNYYQCINGACSKRRAIKKSELETSFTEFLNLITPNEGLMVALEEALKIEYEQVYKSNITKSDALEKKIRKLRDERDKLLQMRLNGEIDNTTFIEEGEKRKSLIHDLELEQKHLTNPSQGVASAVQFGIRVIRELPFTWERLEPGELRELREALFPQNLKYLYPGFKTAELSPIFKVKAASGEDANRFVTLRGIEPRFRP